MILTELMTKVGDDLPPEGPGYAADVSAEAASTEWDSSWEIFDEEINPEPNQPIRLRNVDAGEIE